MNIIVKFNAQLRDRLGCEDRDVELEDGASTKDLLQSLHQQGLTALFASDGQLLRSVMIFINGQQRRKTCIGLRDGDVVNLLTPIAGG